MSEASERQSILSITRAVYRGTNASFFMECDGIRILIQPNKLQKYTITELLYGGGPATIHLPCQLRTEDDKDLTNSQE